MDHAALDQLAEEELLRERLLDMLLDDARERAGAEELVVALFAEPFARLDIELDRDVAVGELLLELENELVDDAADGLWRQRREGDHRVEAVAELRREEP